MELESVILKFEELYSNITLQEFNNNLEEFTREYDKVKKASYVRLQLIRKWKDWIYSLNMAEYKKDRIWEYLNDDIDREYFNHFVEAVYKGWFK